MAAGFAGVLVVPLGATALAGLAAVPPLPAVVLTVFPVGLGGILLLWSGNCSTSSLLNTPGLL